MKPFQTWPGFFLSLHLSMHKHWHVHFEIAGTSCSPGGKKMREHAMLPKGTIGRRPVRVLEEGPQLPFNPLQDPSLGAGALLRAQFLAELKKERCRCGTNFTLSPMSHVKRRSLWSKCAELQTFFATQTRRWFSGCTSWPWMLKIQLDCVFAARVLIRTRWRKRVLFKLF